MSKYRVSFVKSRLQLVILMASYGLLMLSVWFWQQHIIDFQVVLQLLVVFGIAYFAYKAIARYRCVTMPTVVFSEKGEWIEMGEQQSSWVLSEQSRVTGFVLFVHVVSAMNPKLGKWYLVFKDQVSERDYRRFCRAIFFQQQKQN